MRGFRIATCLFLLGVTLSCLNRPSSGQDLSLVAAAVEAEAATSCQPSAISDQLEPSLWGTLVATDKCGPGGCRAEKAAGCSPQTAGCSPGCQCATGEPCVCESCPQQADACSLQPVASPEHSIVTHRGHVFDGEAKFMERGPGRRLVGRVFGRVREAVGNRPRLLRRALGRLRGCGHRH